MAESSSSPDWDRPSRSRSQSQGRWMKKDRAEPPDSWEDDDGGRWQWWHKDDWYQNQTGTTKKIRAQARAGRTGMKKMMVVPGKGMMKGGKRTLKKGEVLNKGSKSLGKGLAECLVEQWQSKSCKKYKKEMASHLTLRKKRRKGWEP